MKTVDLHCHTHYSDGTFSPEELFALAKEKDIAAIAVTDHDTAEAWVESEIYAREYGVIFIPGVEFSTKISSYEVDILGLNMTGNKAGLSKFLEEEKLFRDHRNQKMIQKLNEACIDISFENVLEKAEGEIVARPHFAKALVEKGYAPTMDFAFKKYLSPGRKTYVEKESHTPEQLIAEIKKAGGVSVLAHPVAYMKSYKISYERVENIVKGLCALGLDGIEAIYPLNTEKDEARWLRLARNYNLRISGGSDFHGANKPHIDLGMLHIPFSVLDDLLQQS